MFTVFLFLSKKGGNEEESYEHPNYDLIGVSTVARSHADYFAFVKWGKEFITQGDIKVQIRAVATNDLEQCLDLKCSNSSFFDNSCIRKGASILFLI